MCPRGDAATRLTRLRRLLRSVASPSSAGFLPDAPTSSRSRSKVREDANGYVAPGKKTTTEDLLHIPRFRADTFEAFASGDRSCGRHQSAVPTLLLPVADGTERGAREKVLHARL
ncbi:hypothetical protein ISCGN_010169 [Ixodes scapularis]